MSIKKVIKNVLPFGILQKISEKRYQSNRVIQYDNKLPDITEEKPEFKYIVSVQGFGFSGSGAVVDFLREFSNCLVLGSVDEEGSLTKGNRHINGEVDLLRHAGGLFEIEKYLTDNNLFTKDALIKRFIKLVEGQSILRSNDAKKLVNQFYNQLIDFEINTNGNNDYNYHLSNSLYPDSNIKIVRNMSIPHYQDLCRRFLVSLFNLYHSDNKQYLILDQLVGDFNYDTEKYKQYIPNLKTILVVRDPRDIYSYAITKDVPWIPHDTVDKFIKWFKINSEKVDPSSKDYLIVRFEDFVLDYENYSYVLMSYLGLEAITHNKQFKCFNPKISVANVSVWKKMANHQSAMEKIHEELLDHCFEN